MNIPHAEAGGALLRPLTAVVTAAAAVVALSGCTEKKPDFAAFCVATSPSNVDAGPLKQAIQNTTMRLGVSKESYKANFTLRKYNLVGPAIVHDDGSITTEKFEGTIVDTIKLKLAADRHQDPKEWRNVPILSSDLLVLCYNMKDAGDYNKGGEIFSPGEQTNPVFQTTARNRPSSGPSNYRSLVRDNPEGVFILDASLSKVAAIR